MNWFFNGRSESGANEEVLSCIGFDELPAIAHPPTLAPSPTGYPHPRGPGHCLDLGLDAAAQAHRKRLHSPPDRRLRPGLPHRHPRRRPGLPWRGLYPVVAVAGGAAVAGDAWSWARMVCEEAAFICGVVSSLNAGKSRALEIQ